MLRAVTSSVQELAQGCVRFVQQALELELDYTTDTLPILDHYLVQAREDPRPELDSLIAPAAGAYFGELVRRELAPWRWHCTGDEFEQYRLEHERCFLYFHPVSMALEALHGKPLPDGATSLQVLPSERDAVKEALDRMGQVREEDYYRLCTRYEALEQVLTTLVASSLSRAENPVRLGPEVYAAAIDGAAEGTTN